MGVVDHRGGAAELEDVALQQVRDHDVGVEPRRAVARLEIIRERCRRELHHPAPCGSLIWRTLAPRGETAAMDLPDPSILTAVQDLYACYAHRIDRRDFDGFAALFTEDGHFALGDDGARGRDAIRPTS